MLHSSFAKPWFMRCKWRRDMCHSWGQAVKSPCVISSIFLPLWSLCVEWVKPSDWSSHHYKESPSKESSGSRKKLLYAKPLRYGNCLLVQHQLRTSLLICRGRPGVEGNVSNLKSTAKERKLDSEDCVMVPMHLFFYQWNKNSKMTFNMLQFCDYM